MINLYKLKLTILQQEIIRLFFIKANNSLNQRRIANLLEVSPPAVMKALPGLTKQGYVIVEQDKESKRLSIKLNRENPKILQLKRTDNLKQIYESGLAEHIENKFPGTTIILFGSYSRGEDTASSDIDMAVIGSKEKSLEVEIFEKMLERKINIVFFKSFHSINKHLKENILNGISIVGGIEL